MALIVVLGPPAAGKSTWVLVRAKPTDLVIDHDRLAVALTGQGAADHDHSGAITAVTQAARTAAIQTALRHRDSVDVYVIHSTPSGSTVAQYRRMGAQVVTIDPGRDVVLERCRRLRPPAMLAVAEQWYAQHAQQPDHQVTTRQPSRTW